jgi:hypothetical protein
LDDRILISTYISMGIVLLIAMDRALKHRAPGAAVLAATALLVLVGRQVDQLGATVARLRRDGQGYAAARWQESDTAHSLVALRPTVIYTNDITAVYFVAGYPSCGIPTRGAEAALNAMQRDLGREGAVLAIFGDLSSEFMPEEKLTDGLVAIWTFDDGRIYQAHEQ